MLHAQQRPQDIRIECCCVAFRSLVGDRPGLTLGSRAVHRDVEATEARDHSIYEIAQIVVAANVDADKLRIGAEGAQLAGKRLTRVVPAT